MTRLMRFVAVLLAIQSAQAAVAAGPILIVSNKARKPMLEKSDLRDVYLGARTMVGDWRVVPVDQEGAPGLREGFYRAIAGRSLVEMRVHWAEQVFSGRGRAPRAVANDEAVLDYVHGNPDAIGYVSSSADTSKVNVILRIDQ